MKNDWEIINGMYGGKSKKEINTIFDGMSDQDIVAAILNRDEGITVGYLYKKCYPLFKALYTKYFTDCETCIDFISEIYAYILSPGEKTGKCYLSTFGFGCTLTCWLKIVATNYCRQLYKKRIEFVDLDNSEGSSDRFLPEPVSPIIEEMERDDVETILGLMPNKRYSRLIRFRYVEEMTNEETANMLGMSKENFYNKHKLAKKQFTEIARKEGLI